MTFRTDERADRQTGGVRSGHRTLDADKWGTSHRVTGVLPDKDLDPTRENEWLRRENRILKEERDILN